MIFHYEGQQSQYKKMTKKKKQKYGLRFELSRFICNRNENRIFLTGR